MLNRCSRLYFQMFSHKHAYCLHMYACMYTYVCIYVKESINLRRGKGRGHVRGLKGDDGNDKTF